MKNLTIKSLANLAKNEWSKRTLSEAAWKAYQQTGKLPKGLQGWRPLKAFTPKMLSTGPTPAAGLVSSLLIGGLAGKAMENNLPVSDFKSGRNAGRKAFNKKEKK